MRDGAVLDTWVSRERDEAADRERMLQWLIGERTLFAETTRGSGIARWKEAVERFTAHKREDVSPTIGKEA
jgi:hypothetical protein